VITILHIRNIAGMNAGAEGSPAAIGKLNRKLLYFV
jgi:hypothetical protein